MKAIITVLGTDKVGIIAKVCTYLADREINILDISQTIIQGYFNMLMIIEVNDTMDHCAEIADGLEKLGEEIGVVIKMQHEDIFNTMHRI